MRLVDVNRLRGQTCLILTRGRRTGVEHAVRTWFVIVDGRFYAAVRRGMASDWLQNALHAGELEVRLGKSSWSGQVSLAPDEDIPAVVEAYADKYHRHPKIISEWRKEPPVFARVAS